jgi:hypothetical protein
MSRKEFSMIQKRPVSVTKSVTPLAEKQLVVVCIQEHRDPEVILLDYCPRTTAVMDLWHPSTVQNSQDLWDMKKAIQATCKANWQLYIPEFKK